MTVYEPDTSAAAVVLCHFGTVEYWLKSRWPKYKYSFHKRIKILKKTGYDYGNVQVLFRSIGKQEEFKFDKAQVRWPTGEVYKLKKKDVVEEKLDNEWSVAKLLMPKLTEGCIIEYAYDLVTEPRGSLRAWYFQEEIPVKWSEFRIALPSYLDFTYLLQGVDDMPKVKDDPRHMVFEGNGKQCEILPNQFIFKNMPAYVREAYITSDEDCLAKVKFQLSEVLFFFMPVKLNENWTEFGKMMAALPWFGQQYLDSTQTANAAKEILPQLPDAVSRLDRAKALYRHVAENMQWDNVFTFSAQSMAPLDSVYAQRKGTSGEINLLLLALLRKDGFEANPVLVSTRTHGKPYSDFPMIDQFNHTLVQVVADSTTLFLDAVDPLRPPGYVELEAINGGGALLRGDTAYWVAIPPPNDATDFYKYEASLLENGDLRGKLKSTYKGYNALFERKRYTAEEKKNHWEERLLKKFPALVVDSSWHGDPKLVANSFYDSLYFHADGAAQLSGDFIYLPTVFFSSFEENLFKEEKRRFPIDFSIPMLEQYQMRLKLPPGYKVESLPKSTKVALESNGGSFTYSIEKSGDSELNIHARLQIRQTIFSPEQYPALKNMMNMVGEKMGEMIVLKKG